MKPFDLKGIWKLGEGIAIEFDGEQIFYYVNGTSYSGSYKLVDEAKTNTRLIEMSLTAEPNNLKKGFPKIRIFQILDENTVVFQLDDQEQIKVNRIPL